MVPFAIAQIIPGMPSGPAEFLNILEQYNLAVWPAQVVLYLLGLIALALVVRGWTESSDKFVAGILATLWLWVAVAQWYAHFAPVAGFGFFLAVEFAIQVGLLLYLGVWKDALEFGFTRDRYSLVGVLFVLYALAFPVIGLALGRLYPQMASLGAACPTVTFTFGVLLLTVRRVPKVLLVIPLLFALGDIVVVLDYGMYEDIGLVLAGIIGTALLVYRDRTERTFTPRSTVRA